MNSKKPVDFSDLKSAFQYKSSYELRKAHLLFSIINHPLISKVLTSFAKFSLWLHLPVKGMIRKTVFSHFCGGESIEDSRKTVVKMDHFGVQTILDYSVEGEKTEKGFEKTKAEIIRIIMESGGSKEIPFTVFKMTGLISFAVMAKKQSDYALLPREQEMFDKGLKRVDEVCRVASEHDIPIMIDAEETWIQDTIDEVVLSMIRKYNQAKAQVFNTYQMYRVDSLNNLKRDIEVITGEDLYFGAKLVRGAYMEKERERAEEKSYKSPIHISKENTDQCFDDGVRLCFEKREQVAVVCGTHNEKSNQLLAALIDDHQEDRADHRFWFAQLYGMSDNISFNLAKEGFNVAKYVPYGPVLSVMPYLIRRAEENTSVAGQSSRELTMIRKELQRRKKFSDL